MLRLLGMLLLVLTGAFAGFQASLSLAKRERELELFFRFVQSAETEILFSALPVAEVVGRHGGELPFLRRCARLCQEGEDFFLAWERAVRETQPVDRGDAELYLRFGEGFGTTDAPGQAAHCRLTLGLTEQRLRDAREERRQKGRLYRMLGVLGGLAAALLFC